MALLAPIPTASVVTATIVKSGVRTNLRRTYRRWLLKDFMACLSTKQLEPRQGQPDPPRQLNSKVSIRMRDQKSSPPSQLRFLVSPMKIPPSLCGIRVIREIRGQKNQPRNTQISERTTMKAIFIRCGEPQDHGNLVVITDSPRSTPRHQDSKVSCWQRR